MSTPTAKNLAVEAPVSPRVRTGGYAILARAADKGRATLAGTKGEYHFACPLDLMLFAFKGVSGDDVLAQIKAGATNEQLAEWLNANGTPKTAEEITAWSDAFEADIPYNHEDKREYALATLPPLGLDPLTATFCDFLEADDAVTFQK